MGLIKMRQVFGLEFIFGFGFKRDDIVGLVSIEGEIVEGFEGSEFVIVFHGIK